MTDILLKKTDADYYDFEIYKGDFLLTDGFDTAIIISLLTDRRADSSEVSPVELRRGWFGNLILRNIINDSSIELGSKLWLLYQARQMQNTINFARNASNEALIWLVEYRYALSVVSEVSAIDESTILDEVSIILDDNVKLKRSFELGNIN